MATTYSTNSEIRKTYQIIDNCLPVTKSTALTALGASTVPVDSTEAFALTGTVYFMTAGNVLTSFTYTRKDRTNFYLAVVTTAAIPDNAEITTGDDQLDHFRDLAKSFVDTMLTNHNIPTNFKKTLEIDYVFYQAAKASYDPNKRAWAQQIMETMKSFIEIILSQYGPVIRNGIAYLAESGLTDRDKDILLNGPRVGC